MNHAALMRYSRLLGVLAYVVVTLAMHGCDARKSDRPDWLDNLKGSTDQAHIERIESHALQSLRPWASLGPDAVARQNAHACMEMAKMPRNGVWPRTPIVIFAGMVDMGSGLARRYEMFVVVFDVWGGQNHLSLRYSNRAVIGVCLSKSRRSLRTVVLRLISCMCMAGL